jgi:hypothetical protein
MKKNFLFGLVVSFVLLLASQSVFAQVNVNGRVTEASSGNGVYMVHIDAVPTNSWCGTWSGASALTNGFGYYSFTSPHIYCSMVIIPSKKGRTFTPNAIVINGGIDPTDNVDFVAD